MKYLLETPVRGKIGGKKFETAIQWRNGVLITDEPEILGGKDKGPDPYTLLLSSLVSCTLATLRMYIDLKGLDIPEIEVEANMHQGIENHRTVLKIVRRIVIRQEADLELQERLVRVAENCPVSRILKGDIKIATEMN
ncbi:osmotically inducible protein OsmC [Pedobacter yulinensis]|uniref:Osmotically inducible protein OsmC n=1 Tax=Pedobacter yulinensis TaxID=2126353 RepID=A0A2T3HLF5_9SPHI|nr:OsmC family protein [Pedobacter yulinensis]PST83277.1 osmotically inducible protein OsmC [Pedobacter yulinensis]